MPEDIPVDPAEEQSAEPERPEWLPQKFKSEEDFAKSYSELENRLREQGEERNALEAQLEDVYGRVQAMEQGAAQAQYDPSTDPTIIAYESAMEQGDYKAALAIQAGLMQTIAQQAIPQQPPSDGKPADYETWAYVAEQTAIQQIGDPQEWAAYKDRVAEEAKKENFDDLSATKAGEKLARLYRMVKADDVLNNQETLAEQQAAADREAKLAAQSMSGFSGRPDAPTQDEKVVDAIKKAAKEGSYNALTGG